MDDLREADFPDWEILPSQERSVTCPPEVPQDHQKSEFVEDESHAIIKPLYFSSDTAVNFMGLQEASEGDTSGVDPEREDPNWVDPCLESCLREKVVELEESEEEKPEKSWDSGDSLPENHVLEPERMEVEVFAGCDEESKEVGGGLEPGGLEEKEFSVVGQEEFSVVGQATKVRSWWRVPFELMKIFVLRSSPFWSLSVGVVAMGVLVLGRRWYKAKHKTQSSIKVCVEDKAQNDRHAGRRQVLRLFPILMVVYIMILWGYDLFQKKVSQFMVQAARLNEAFSVVTRVPVIRSSLLHSGVSPWPVIGIR